MVFVLSFDVGIKNLAYCLINSNNKIIDWKVIDVSGSNDNTHLKRMYQALENIKFEPDTHVVIEKQPRCNPKMRIVAGQLKMYFIPKLIRKEISCLVYFSPRKKLSDKQDYMLLFKGEEIGKKKYSTKYAQRKYHAKEYCRIILARDSENNEKWGKYFKDKKSADLADTLLQGMAYINEKKIF